MMRVVSACVVALVAGALAAEIELDEGVLVGTADNFEVGSRCFCCTGTDWRPPCH